MAKKGQKFNSYTAEFKQKILDEWANDNKPPNRLAHENGISRKTIETWIRKLKKPEEYPGFGNKKGRPKETEADWKERYQILKKFRVFLKAQRERK
jgi:transposase-like protein